MDGLRKMLEELFGNPDENSRPDEQETENQNLDEEKPEKHSRVKMACATVLSDMRREINSLERALAALNVKREMLIEEHNALVEEVKSLEKEPPVSAAPEPAAEPGSQGKEPPLPEEETHEDERHEEEELPESALNLDGMSRLERLQFGLNHAAEVLGHTKMAFHFKAIKQLRLDLIELSNADDKPEEERIAELEFGMKHAVEVLSNSPNASNSKTMRQLWNDLIAVLKTEDDPQQ